MGANRNVPVNILVVNYRDRLHPAAGGAEKHLHRIFKRIVAMGHQVVLLTTKFKGAEKREVVDGIQVVRSGGDLFFQLTVACAVRRLDKEFHFDVVYEDLNKLPLFTPKLLKKPVLVQMHHLWRKSIFAETVFPVALGVWAFERAIPLFYKKQPFVVVSPSTKKELVEIGVPENRVDIVYNGSDPVEMPCQLPSEKPYFLWLSRVHRYKGIWVALQAFEIFAKKVPDVKLVVAGSGPLLPKLSSWLKARGLEDRVELAGFVTPQRKRELLAGAVALLQTSYKEGWGLTVVEAAQLDAPTIASNVPGLKDSVKDGETGILFPAGDAAACSAAMERVYSDETLRDTLAKAAKEYAMSFSWDDAAEQTVVLLEKTIAEYGKAGAR